MIGTTISHYKILEKLGEGGMGVVYKAHDTTLNRTVALKFLPSQIKESAEDKARFLQEAQAAAQLNHPNICTIHGIEESDGQIFIVMEFVDGKTLGELKQAVSLNQSIDYGIQISEGLAAAHEKGIVHRDLKPDNIMIRKDGRVLIMDFGLAKLKGISRLTKEGSIVGTAGYMSPEQAQGNETDHRSDIFSLGVMLYELIAGKSPFKGAHETAVLYEIVNVDTEPISSVKPDIDPELDGVVLECLAKEPTERFQSAAEVAKDLRRYKRASSRSRASRVMRVPSGLKGPASSVDGSPPNSLSSHTTSRPLIPWIAAGIFLTSTIVLGAIHFASPSPETHVYRSTILPPEKNVFTTAFGGHIALSPDGRALAFVARDSLGRTLLWVRPLNELSGYPLAGTEDATFPFWSPDGRSIGFFTDTKLRRIEAAGGPVQTICDAQGARGGSWNKEGTIIFCPNPNITTPLSRVSATGGVPREITKLNLGRGETSHRWPLFLPDGKHFLFISRTSAGSVGERDAIFLGSLDTSFAPRQLMDGSSSLGFSNGFLLFARDQTLMARAFDATSFEFTGEAFPVADHIHFEDLTSKASFTVSQDGTLAYQTGIGTSGARLIWMDRNGKLLEAVRQTKIYNDFRISPDGKRIALSMTDRGLDVWLYEISRETWTKFTFDAASKRWPLWTPDGKTVIFSSSQKGHWDLHQRASDGASAETPFLETENDKVANDWSRDGKYLLFISTDAKTKSDIWVLPLTAHDDAERKPFVFLRTEFDETRPVFSPDVRWIAYQSNESGVDEIYIQPFSGMESGKGAISGKWKVSTNGGSRPRWRRDGKELYYLSADLKIMAAEITLGASTVTIGSVRPLFAVRPFGGVARDIYDVTPDGQRFLVASQGGEEAASPVTLVVNWIAEVKNK